MPRKNDYPKIGQVLYLHVGTDEDYNNFLRATIYDYLGHKFDSFEKKPIEEKPVSKRR